MTELHPQTVVVAGAGGNLGTKLVAHLLTLDWCSRVVALDYRTLAGEPFTAPRVETRVTNLADPNDSAWIDAVAEADAVVHLAARNPAPDSTWADGVVAFDQTTNLLFHAARGKPRRFVFASSNHTMGGYKDAGVPHPGFIGSDTEPLSGTRVYNGREHLHPTAYAATKLYGERTMLAAAAASGGSLTAVALRIGWCQPGENDPVTIAAAGGATASGGRVSPEAARDLVWFRNMWLSNRDLAAVFEAALTADATAWPTPGVVVAAVSNNTGTPWNLAESARLIGYRPVDDVWARLGIAPPA